jgi:SAM-dependent methyltransferase
MAVDTSPPQPTTIQRLATAVFPSFAMLAGMQLDLFTPLKDGPMTAEQLAAALNVKAEKLSPLLYALVAAELLTVDGGRFANTPEADHYLVKGKPTYMGGRHGIFSQRWHAVLKTADSIQTGEPQAPLDFVGNTPEELEAFFRRYHTETIPRGQELVHHFDLSSAQTLVDIGGGSGGLALAVTEACPHIHATVVDLPTVTPITQRFIEEAGATDRVHVLAANVVNETLPETFDVAVLSSFIQVLTPEEARRALKHVFQALNPGGTIYIRGQVLDNSHLSPTEIAAASLFFVNAFRKGGAYTEQEYKDWLTEASFVDFERLVLPDAHSFIRARKPA